MLIPIAVYVVLLSAGVFLATRWLPALAAGREGGLACVSI